MQLKLATKKDIGKIVEITKSDGFHKPADPIEIEKSMEQGDRYFLAHDPEPIGFVKLVFNKEGESELAFFSMISAFQGKGAGPEILKCVEKEISATGKTKLYARCRLANGKAMKFYQKNGFENTGQLVEGSDGEVVRLVKTIGIIQKNG